MLRLSQGVVAGWLRRLGVIGFVLFVLACSGGGCSSGCAGCGVTPLPGGFPKASAITNAGSARVTRAGLDFMQANLGAIAGKALGGGTETFAISKSSDDLGLGNSVTICASPDSTQCVADINIAGAALTLTAVHPDSLTITGTIPVKVEDIPVEVYIFTIDTCTIHASLGTGGNCDANVQYTNVPVTVTLPLVAETIAPRDGYTKIDTANATISANIASSQINFCGGFCADIASALQSFLVGQLTGPLNSQLKSAIQTELCTKTNTALSPSCPTGTHDNGGTCYYDSQATTCVPILPRPRRTRRPQRISREHFARNCRRSRLRSRVRRRRNRFDVARRQHARLDERSHARSIGGVFAEPAIELRARIHEQRVPTGIPVPDEMLSNNVTPWPAGDNGPDLGIALAGRFLDLHVRRPLQRGTLCLGHFDGSIFAAPKRDCSACSFRASRISRSSKSQQQLQ